MESWQIQFELLTLIILEFGCWRPPLGLGLGNLIEHLGGDTSLVPCSLLSRLPCEWILYLSFGGKGLMVEER